MNKRFKGVNLGSWLNMEGYILGGRNIPESFFKREFERRWGSGGLKQFEQSFRDTFIQEQDFRAIAEMGATAVRIPFHYRIIEHRRGRYDASGLGYLDKAMAWAEKYGLGVILDLHAACGSQNHDWHSDSSGKALFWDRPAYRKRTLALWEAVCDRFKDSPALYAYDVLNEPVLDQGRIPVLKKFYVQALRTIQSIDRRHTIFLEGNTWAQEIDFLADLVSEQVGLSIHTYLPSDYTFRYTPFERFPGTSGGKHWDAAAVRAYLEPYHTFAQKNRAQLYVGEFGINWRGGQWGECAWLESMLTAFEEFGFSYTYWTYKAIAGHVFPDGLYQYLPNAKYVNRQGPRAGWETYIEHWKREQKTIRDFWRTEGFTPNVELIGMLRGFFKR